MPAQWRSARRRHRGIKPSILALAAVAVACTLLLAISATSNSFSRLCDTRRTAEWVDKFALLFEAATELSAERGPAGTYMAASGEAAGRAREAWFVARRRTDQSFEVARALGAPQRELDEVRQQLNAGRILVQMVAVEPASERTPAEVQQAVDVLVAAWDRYRANILTRWGAGAIEQDPLLADVMMKSSAFSDLREYADRIGSFLTGSMTGRTAIPQRNLQAINALRSQIDQIWQLLAPARLVDRSRSAFYEKTLDVQRIYLTSGLDLIASEIEQGGTSGRFSMNVETFTREYLRVVQPVTDLRDEYFRQLKRQHEMMIREATISLLVDCALTIVLLALVPISLAIIRSRILRPLLRGVADVIALAEGRTIKPRLDDHSIAEISSLYTALTVLSERLTERARLTSEFERLALTDSLTGLSNRRGFYEEARTVSAQGDINLIIGDIDLFKDINDRFGHPVGDRVLAGVAEIMRRIAGPRCRIGRIGGEEFAIVSLENLDDVVGIAEMIRIAVGAQVFHADDGRSFSVSISFGVAAGGATPWAEQVRRADAALYRAKSQGRNRVCIAADGYESTPGLKNLTTAA